MSGGRKTQQTTLVCPECGTEITIWRKRSRLRPGGHVKHIWCFVCKAVTGHVEL